MTRVASARRPGRRKAQMWLRWPPAVATRTRPGRPRPSSAGDAPSIGLRSLRLASAPAGEFTADVVTTNQVTGEGHFGNTAWLDRQSSEVFYAGRETDNEKTQEAPSSRVTRRVAGCSGHAAPQGEGTDVRTRRARGRAPSVAHRERTTLRVQTADAAGDLSMARQLILYHFMCGVTVGRRRVVQVVRSLSTTSATSLTCMPATPRWCWVSRSTHRDQAVQAADGMDRAVVFLVIQRLQSRLRPHDGSAAKRLA